MYLPTNLQYKLLEIQSKICNYFGVIPFVWDPSTKSYKSSDKALQNFKIFSLITLPQYIFVTLEFIRLRFYVDEKLSRLCILFIGFLALTLYQWDAYVFSIKGKEFICLLNMIKQHPEQMSLKYLKSRDDPRYHKARKLWDQTTISNLISSSLIIMVSIVHYIVYPSDHAYVTKYIHNSEHIPYVCKLVIYIIYGVILTISMVKLNYTFCFHNNMMFEIQTQYLPLIHRELRLGGSENLYETKNTLRTVQNLGTEYHTLNLVTRLYMEVVGLLLIPGHIICLNMALFSNVSLIRKWNVLDRTSKVLLILVSTLAHATWLLVLHGSGILNLFSIRILTSWKTAEWGTRANRVYMIKVRRSCRPLSIGYKNHFKYKRTSILGFLKGLYRGTFRALCAIKGSEN